MRPGKKSSRSTFLFSVLKSMPDHFAVAVSEIQPEVRGVLGVLRIMGGIGGSDEGIGGMGVGSPRNTKGTEILKGIRGRGKALVL